MRFAVCCMLLVFGGLRADPSFGVRVWSVAEGLPSSRVSGIVQGEDGRLWLATSRGLSVFDGLTFKNYDHNTVPELGTSELTALAAGSDGRIWFADRSGRVGLFAAGRFQSVDMGARSLGEYVIQLAVNNAGLTVAATSEGRLLEFSQGDPETFREPSEWFELERQGSPGLQICFDRQDRVWSGLHSELLVWAQNGLIRVLPELHVDTSENQPWLWALLPSPRGGVWVAADVRLRRWRDGAWVEDRGAFPWEFDFGISSMVETYEGTLWVGAPGRGIRGIPADGDEPYILTVDEGLPTNDVLTLFEDAERNVWLGTDGGGLVRVRPQIFQVFGEESGLGDVPVNAIAEDFTHDVWMATDGRGLVHWDGYQYRSVLERDKAHVTTVLRDSLGRIWAGTRGRGLCGVLPEEEIRQEYRVFTVEAYDDQTISTLYEGQGDRLWVASENGLSQLPLSDPDQTPVYRFPDLRDVRCLIEDGHGSFWIAGGEPGLLRWRDGELTRFTVDDGVPDDRVTAMCLDSDQRLWIGTYGGGVARFREGRFEALEQSGRLSNGFISGMINDGREALWLASARGISRLRWDHLKNRTWEEGERVQEMVFGAEDGLEHIECSEQVHPSILVSELGRLFFPLKRGIAQVDLGDVDDELAWVPPIGIRTVSVDGVEAPMTDGSLEVAEGAKRIEIGFSGVALASPERAIYRYRLPDQDSSWSSLGATRSVALVGLEPGTYQFEVSAAHQSGPWNDVPAVLAINVGAFWWQTSWARWGGGLVGLSLIGAAIWGIASRRLRLTEARRSLEQAVARERERIAQDMHDDLGARLTQLSFQGEIVRRSAAEQSDLQGRLEAMMAGVRQTAQALDDIVWMTNPRNDRLDRLVSHLGQMATEMSETVGWRLALSLPQEMPGCVVSGRCRHEIVMVVKEAINNASKHSGGATLSVDVSIAGGSVVVSVGDDGSGFEVASEATQGNGLGQMQRRIESTQGTVRIDSRVGTGTTVTISVPLSAIVQ